MVKASESVGVALVFALVLLLVGNIVAREAFGVPLVWANEVSLILFSWAVFIGAAVAFSRGARIRFDFVRQHLPARLDRALDMMATGLGLAALVTVMLIGLRLVELNWQHRLTSLDASAAWHWACLPAGATIALVGWLSSLGAEAQ